MTLITDVESRKQAHNSPLVRIGCATFLFCVENTFVLTKMNDVIFTMMPLRLSIKGRSILETFVFAR